MVGGGGGWGGSHCVVVGEDEDGNVGRKVSAGGTQGGVIYTAGRVSTNGGVRVCEEPGVRGVLYEGADDCRTGV